MKQPIKEIWINYYQRGDDPLGWATPFYSKDQAERDTTYGRTKTVHFVEAERAEKAEAACVEAAPIIKEAIEISKELEKMREVVKEMRDFIRDHAHPRGVLDGNGWNEWWLAKDKCLARAKEIGVDSIHAT